MSCARAVRPAWSKPSPNAPDLGINRLVLLALARVDRRQVRQVALDRAGELVAVVLDDAQVRLAARPLAPGAPVEAHAAPEPRPLGGHEEDDGGDE